MNIFLLETLCSNRLCNIVSGCFLRLFSTTNAPPFPSISPCVVCKSLTNTTRSSMYSRHRVVLNMASASRINFFPDLLRFPFLRVVVYLLLEAGIETPEEL